MLNGAHTHTQQWALGFDVLTRTTLKSHRKMMKEDKKIKSNDMIVFASTVMSQTFLLCTIKKYLVLVARRNKNILLVIAARVGNHLDFYL